ncbi:hypothetical protein DPMN_016256 [Dreissena polymorpha]|uniref:Uncharacterized protein n=1 Tax=Dreissena polymorpha TaxID=45954 RepID=A0A9D4NEG2_DREPO|nr:hypothetical protein DPMN_016256 [Dreissena polymorpha]
MTLKKTARNIIINSSSPHSYAFTFQVPTAGTSYIDPCLHPHLVHTPHEESGDRLIAEFC